VIVAAPPLINDIVDVEYCELVGVDAVATFTFELDADAPLQEYRMLPL